MDCPEASGHLKGIGRILALSDGVFAIAITLLILEIAIPATTGDTGLTKARLGLWPRYLAYVLSFVVIARFWVTHHLAFRLIGRYGSCPGGGSRPSAAQSVQVPLVGWLAVAAVGGDRAARGGYGG